MKSKDPGSVTLSTLSPPLESDMWSQADLMDIPGLDISSESPISDLSDDDSTNEVSLELGRGAAKPPRRLDDSRSSVMSFQNSVRSSSPAVRVEYPTPQKNQPVRSSTRRAVSENLRKDAQLRRANQAQKENSSKQQSKHRDQRRTLSDMHARVRDNYEGSFLGDERPAPMTGNTRSTRFGNANHSQEIAEAVERASRDAYTSERAKMNPEGTPRPTVHGSMGDTFTRNSFLLPDLPNLSELVSGVYEDGTPVLPRQTNMRSTRFASPPHDNVEDVSLTREHMPLDAIPIPEDEKALFVSLRLLQEKVTELEQFKSNAEERLKLYRDENAALKAGRSGLSDKSGARDRDYKGSSNRSTRDQQKLEAANITLQNQLDLADRKAHIQEAALQRLNQEREAAISQLGIAYLESRELKDENEALRQENAALKEQAARSIRKNPREQETRDSQQSSSPSDADESQRYTEHSGDLSRSTKDLTSKSTRSESKARRQEESRAKISTQVDKEISRLEKERAEEALFTLDVPVPKRASKMKSDGNRNADSKNAKKQSNTSKQRSKRVVVDDFSGPVDITEATKASNVEDLTLLSTIDVSGQFTGKPNGRHCLPHTKENEIARLRKTLEVERLARKQRRSSALKEPTETEATHTTRQGILKTPAPLKSSLREPKMTIPRPASATGDITARSAVTSEGENENSLTVPSVERPRRHSVHSLPPNAQRKKRRNIEDMTSAFILPDITLNRADLAASNPTKLPEATRRVLDGIAQHDGKNCMVCKNVHPSDGSCNHEPVKIPKPVPVSQRMPKPSLYNEEPTVRPSQPPAVALAGVLKTLEDELSHLKMQLVSYQGAYNKLDASLGKRQRKALVEKIETLMKDIDMKSDQIYALYDVLEGQKQVGHDMTEQEMEMTLESIGIDIPADPEVTGTTDKSRGPVEFDEEDEDEEFPWEGIESTAELTGRA
ncbi:hypothetical protein N7492_005597 [Penicillium capsulatum]|uniref:Cep57 centrosome microtubule-binding domain-containing protein n=1 Tax=Penicillium capsulatum TaxID=69766 RepID=A0A9W9LR65_9EURO|nr:hypothetical protein N7492_005597 [Penicillium capsulatum]KAJ6135304.1 hypothetical protein N7512_000464 [Penicillium capsulatum]